MRKLSAIFICMGLIAGCAVGQDFPMAGQAGEPGQPGRGGAGGAGGGFPGLPGGAGGAGGNSWGGVGTYPGGPSLYNYCMSLLYTNSTSSNNWRDYSSPYSHNYRPADCRKLGMTPREMRDQLPRTTQPLPPPPRDRIDRAPRDGADGSSLYGGVGGRGGQAGAGPGGGAGGAGGAGVAGGVGGAGGQGGGAF